MSGLIQRRRQVKYDDDIDSYVAINEGWAFSDGTLVDDELAEKIHWLADPRTWLQDRPTEKILALTIKTLTAVDPDFTEHPGMSNDEIHHIRHGHRIYKQRKEDMARAAERVAERVVSDVGRLSIGLVQQADGNYGPGGVDRLLELSRQARKLLGKPERELEDLARAMHHTTPLTATYTSRYHDRVRKRSHFNPLDLFHVGKKKTMRKPGDDVKPGGGYIYNFYDNDEFTRKTQLLSSGSQGSAQVLAKEFTRKVEDQEDHDVLRRLLLSRFADGGLGAIRTPEQIALMLYPESVRGGGRILKHYGHVAKFGTKRQLTEHQQDEVDGFAEQMRQVDRFERVVANRTRTMLREISTRGHRLRTNLSLYPDTVISDESDLPKLVRKMFGERTTQANLSDGQKDALAMVLQDLYLVRERVIQAERMRRRVRKPLGGSIVADPIESQNWAFESGNPAGQWVPVLTAEGEESGKWVFEPWTPDEDPDGPLKGDWVRVLRPDGSDSDEWVFEPSTPAGQWISVAQTNRHPLLVRGIPKYLENSGRAKRDYLDYAIEDWEAARTEAFAPLVGGRGARFVRPTRLRTLRRSAGEATKRAVARAVRTIPARARQGEVRVRQAPRRGAAVRAAQGTA